MFSNADRIALLQNVLTQATSIADIAPWRISADIESLYQSLESKTELTDCRFAALWEALEVIGDFCREENRKPTASETKDIHERASAFAASIRTLAGPDLPAGRLLDD